MNRRTSEHLQSLENCFDSRLFFLFSFLIFIYSSFSFLFLSLSFTILESTEIRPANSICFHRKVQSQYATWHFPRKFVGAIDDPFSQKLFSESKF